MQEGVEGMAAGSDVARSADPGDENDPEHQHYPYVRHVRVALHRDGYGQWMSESWENSQWEVICAECGDTEGPLDEQTVEVRRLRGPYVSRHKAERAAHGHERREDIPLRWTPGSASPIPL